MAGPRLRAGRQGLPTPAHKMKKSYISLGYKGDISFNIRYGQVEQKAEAHRRRENTVRRLCGRPYRTSKRWGQGKVRPHDDGAGEAQTKKPVADTTGRGTWTGEPPPRIRTAGKGTGSRRHDGYAGSSRRGQRSSSLRRAENSSRRFSPGPGAGRRGIQPQPPFLKTQRMTKNMTMMPMTANNGPGI